MLVYKQKNYSTPRSLSRPSGAASAGRGSRTASRSLRRWKGNGRRVRSATARAGKAGEARGDGGATRNGARLSSLHTRNKNPLASRVRERRTGVSGAQRGAGTERQGRRATPRAACSNGRAESRVRSVFALGRTGAREGAERRWDGRVFSRVMRVAVGNARKRSSPAAPPARLP